MGALHVICGDDDFARKERARRCVEALLDGEIEGTAPVTVAATGHLIGTVAP